jgi:hypothetical protein
VLARLRRVIKLGERLGDFVATVTLRRVGKVVEIRAGVHDSRGDFACRIRQGDGRHAINVLVHQLASRLHQQALIRA